MIQVLFTFKTWIDNSKQKPAEQISANKTQMVQKHNVEIWFFGFALTILIFYPSSSFGERLFHFLLTWDPRHKLEWSKDSYRSEDL